MVRNVVRSSYRMPKTTFAVIALERLFLSHQAKSIHGGSWVGPTLKRQSKEHHADWICKCLRIGS